MVCWPEPVNRRVQSSHWDKCNKKIAQSIKIHLQLSLMDEYIILVVQPTWGQIVPVVATGLKGLDLYILAYN